MLCEKNYFYKQKINSILNIKQHKNCKQKYVETIINTMLKKYQIFNLQ